MQHQAHTRKIAEGPYQFHGAFHDTGTGKTLTAITILSDKCTVHHKLLKTLIVVPPNVLFKWKIEILENSIIPENCITILYGHNEERLRLIQKVEKRDHVFITNYEGLLMENVFQALKQWKPEVVIADELHRVKNHKSKRTKALLSIGDTASYRYGLTGTPVLNSIEDLFSQVRFLDMGRTLGSNYWSFRARFMYDKNRGMPKQRYFPCWLPQPGAEERLHNLIAPFTTHFKKEQCIDLPPLVEVSIPVEMGSEQRRIYQEMKKDFLTFIEGKEVVATMALTKLLRLQQMASGFCRTFSGQDVEIKDSPKAEALKELLEDITPKHKVIVWCAWISNYATVRRVCEELKIGYGELHGQIPVVKRETIAEDFRKNPGTRVVICHPEATGEGIDLIEASYSIVYSRGFSLKHEEQGIARNYRKGSIVHEKITRINLVTMKTVDEVILKALKEKKDLSVKVLEGVKETLDNIENGVL